MQASDIKAHSGKLAGKMAAKMGEKGVIHNAGGEDPVLAGYRQSIDNIDAAMIHILAERFRITQAVGAHKASNKLPPSDPGREERQIARLRALAEDARLDPEFSEKFLRFIIEEVIHHHEQAQAK